MPVTDPIADMLTRIRNANKAKKKYVNIPSSKLKKELARILSEEGFISKYEVNKEEDSLSIIKIYLKYKQDEESVLAGLKRISKPGLRVYVEKDNIPKVMGGFGKAVLSTSKGVLTGKKAKEIGVGGEVICYIW